MNDDWPWTISVGPVADKGVEKTGDYWRWFVNDADGTGVSGLSDTKQQAQEQLHAEIKDWWTSSQPSKVALPTADK